MALADDLAAALARGAARRPELLLGDMREPVAASLPATPAAVLVAVTERARPGVILTERNARLRRHAGQVAFPGGRIDPGEDAVAAALREAEEELGLPRRVARVIGAADRYLTVTGYEVTPVVAVIPPDLPLTPNPDEVADWFEAPLDHLLDAANHSEQEVDWQGTRRRYYEILWHERRIWGATAAMIVNLARRLHG